MSWIRDEFCHVKNPALDQEGAGSVCDAKDKRREGKVGDGDNF